MSQHTDSGRCDSRAGDGSEVAGVPQKLSVAETNNQKNSPSADDACYIALEIALDAATDPRTRRLIRRGLQARLATLESAESAVNVQEGP